MTQKFYTGAFFLCKEPEFSLEEYIKTIECWNCNLYFKPGYEYCPHCGDKLEEPRDSKIRANCLSATKWYVKPLVGIYHYNTNNPESSMVFVFYPSVPKGDGCFVNAEEPAVITKDPIELGITLVENYEMVHAELKRFFKSVVVQFGSLLTLDE